MPEIWVIILSHQLVFQGMFLIKNISVYRKTGKTIRGKNKEATLSTVFFSIFIVVALALAFSHRPPGKIHWLSDALTMPLGLALLSLSLLISGAALIHLKDSWRIGIIDAQATDLVTDGVYRFSRNPYFVSWILLFAGYSLILKNAILFGLLIPCVWIIRLMILAEEAYLHSAHVDDYARYKKKTPRYIGFGVHLNK